MNKRQYRIVCFYPSDEWCVQEYREGNWRGDWWTIHHCTAKGKDGYDEAKKWMEENL